MTELLPSKPEAPGLISSTEGEKILKRKHYDYISQYKNV